MRYFKTVLLVFQLVVFTLTCHGQLADFKSLIDSLYEVDQQVQLDIIEAFQNGVSDADRMALFQRQNETMESHIPILKEIYRAIGYPTIQKVGTESSSNFFTMVQHADADLQFQKGMLRHVKKEVKRGHVDPKEFAFLTDRTRLNSGKSQFFGTQLEYDAKGNANAKNLNNFNKCDKRRMKYGLDPLHLYLENATAMHKSMNPGKYQ